MLKFVVLQEAVHNGIVSFEVPEPREVYDTCVYYRDHRNINIPAFEKREYKEHITIDGVEWHRTTTKTQPSTCVHEIPSWMIHVSVEEVTHISGNKRIDIFMSMEETGFSIIFPDPENLLTYIKTTRNMATFYLGHVLEYDGIIAAPGYDGFIVLKPDKE